MSYSTKERFKIKILNLGLIRFKPVDWLISGLVLLGNILKSVFGKNPEFLGLARLIYRAYYHLETGKTELRITPLGITSQGVLLEKLSFSISKFLPAEGILIEQLSPEKMKWKIFYEMQLSYPHLSRDFHRVTGMMSLGILIWVSCHLYFIYKVYMFIVFGEYQFVLMQLTLMLATVFFGTSTIAFYMGWRKYFYLQLTFKEASIADEYQLKIAKQQPLVATLIPAYLEEPELVKRALYSACLQNYENNHVFLLLGNEFNTTKTEVQENTLATQQIAAKLSEELQMNYQQVNHYYQKFISIESLEPELISEQLLNLHEVCLQITLWFEKKITEFKSDPVKFPLDQYFIENNLNFQLVHYQEKAYQCLKRYQRLKQKCSDENFVAECVRFLQESFIESRRIFAAKFEVFMRTKYANLLQEKTKAANLTAFAGLFGETWHEVVGENGELLLKPDESGRYYPQPDYLCVFDVDTVAKANYLLRKVVYMEQHREQKIAVIQSPYRISCAEFTNVALASGLATTWFLPQYMLYQAIDSSFWQGFNGVMSYEAYQAVGSFMAETMTEDTEISLKFRMKGYRVVSSHEYQCQTLSPEDLKSVRSQRVRWSCSNLIIGKKFLGMLWRKEIKVRNLFELYCNLSYILGLGQLAVAMLIVWFVFSPLYYDNFSLEILPFLMYLLTYAFYYPQIGKFKFMTLVDGLAMNLYLDLNYIQGLFQGVKKLFFEKEQQVMFKATSRKKGSVGQLGFYDLAALISLTSWNVYQLKYLLEKQEYLNFFPVFHLFCIITIIYKFLIKNKRLVQTTKLTSDIEEQRYRMTYRNNYKASAL